MTTASSRPALRLAATSGVELAAAIDAFLSQRDLAATTRAKYRQTLAVVEGEFGDAAVTGPALAGVVEQRWHHASPTTWNRHVARPSDRSRASARAPGSSTLTPVDVAALWRARAASRGRAR